MAEPELIALPPADLSAREPAVPGAGPGAAAPAALPQETVDRMQAVTRKLAFEADAWSAERASEIRGFFDGVAPEWHLRNQAERLWPLADALARGGFEAGGTCVEVGSGTGFQTPTLTASFDLVVSVDLSAEMLVRSPRRAGVGLLRGDANRLPLWAGSVDAVVCVNAFLFPVEYLRVLRRGGAVIFASTRGSLTPIYLPPTEVAQALELAAGHAISRGWTIATSKAGEGTWTVVRTTEKTAIAT